MGRDHVSRVERVELRPEHVGLEGQRGGRRILPFGRIGVVQNIGQAEGDVTRRLLEPLAEIGDGLVVGEVVMREQPGDALLVDARREQLGQRRGDGLEQRRLADEPHIGIDREPRGRQHPLAGGDVVRVQAHRLGQPVPAVDAALAALRAVVVLDAAAPGHAQAPVLAARDQRRVLQGNPALVVIAVDHPGAHLVGCACSRVQERVKGVPVVVALLADPAQAGLECLAGRGHGISSMPSSATIQPASSTARRSGLAGSRTGLVLLMCT